MANSKRWPLGLCLLAAATAASAHTGVAPASGLLAGLAHPLAGLDHLLAMLAVGLWAAQTGGRALWALPAAFLAAMTAGGMAAFAGMPLPAVEMGIAGSVLVFGALIAWGRRMPLPLGLAVTAAFALLHGHAHGSELAAEASAIGYVIGFLATTAALHALGLLAGRLALDRRRDAAVRVAGRMTAVAGAVLAVAAV